MSYRRTLSLLALLAFLPGAVGCSGPRVDRVDVDPGSAGPDSRDPLAIVGYTTADERPHEWEGFVRTVPPDSLQFLQPVQLAENTTRLEPAFRLALADVASLQVLVHTPGTSPGRTLAIAGVVVAVAVVIVAALTYASAPSTGF